MAKKMTLSAVMEMVKKLLQDLPVTISSEADLAAKFAAHRNAVRQIYEGLKAPSTGGVQVAAELSAEEWQQLVRLIQQFTCGLTEAFPTCTPDVMAEVRYSCARSIADIAYFATCNHMAKSIIPTGIVDTDAVNAYVSTLQRSLGAAYKLVKATTYELIRALASLNASSTPQQAKALNDRGVLDVMIEVVSCANGENVDRESRLLAGKVIYGCLSKASSEPGCEMIQLPLATVTAIKRHIKDILDRVPSPASLASSTKALTMPASMPTTLAWIWLLPKPVLDELFDDVSSSSLVVLVNRVLELVWPVGALSTPINTDPRPTLNRNSGGRSTQLAETTESTGLLRNVAGKWLSNLTVRQTIVSLLATLESDLADARLECLLRGARLPSSDSSDGSSAGPSSQTNLSHEPCHQASLSSRLIRFVEAGSLDSELAINVLELLATIFSSCSTSGLVQDALAAGLLHALSSLDTEVAMQTDVGLSGISAYIRCVRNLVMRAATSPELSTQLGDSKVPPHIVNLVLDPRTRRGIRLPALRVLADILRLGVAMAEIVTTVSDFFPSMHKLLITGGNVSGPKQLRISPAVEVKEAAAAVLTAVLSASVKSDKVWQIIASTDVIPQLIQNFQTTTLPDEVLVEALEAVRQALERDHKDNGDILKRLSDACSPHLLPLLVTGQPAVRDAAAQLLSVVLEISDRRHQTPTEGALQGNATSSLMAPGADSKAVDVAAAGGNNAPINAAATGGNNGIMAFAPAATSQQQQEEATVYGLDLICRAIQSQVAAIIPQPPAQGVASQFVPTAAATGSAATGVIRWPDVAAQLQLTGILRDCTVLCDAALRGPASEPSPLRSQLARALFHAKAPLEQLISALEVAGQQERPLQPADDTSPLMAAARRLLGALAELPVLDVHMISAFNGMAAATEPPSAPTGSTPPRRRGRPPGTGKRQRTLMAAGSQLPAKQRRQGKTSEDVDMSQPSEAIEEPPVPRCSRRILGKRRSGETAGEQHLQPHRTRSCDNPAEPTEWLGVLGEATLEADANTAEGAWSLLELRGGFRGVARENDDAAMHLELTPSAYTTPRDQGLLDSTALPSLGGICMHGADESPGLGRQSHDGAWDGGGGGGSGWVSPSLIASGDGDSPDKDCGLGLVAALAPTAAAAAVATMGCATGTSPPVGGSAGDLGCSGGCGNSGSSSGHILASLARFRSTCSELKAHLAARDAEVVALEAKVAQLQAEKNALQAPPPAERLAAVEMQGANREGAAVATEAGAGARDASTAWLQSNGAGDCGGPAPLAQRIRRQVMEYKEQAAKAASELETERQAAAQLRAQCEALKAEGAEIRESQALEVQRIQHEFKQLASTLEAQIQSRLVVEAERDKLLQEREETRSSHAEEVRRVSEEKARKEECLQQADAARKSAEAEVARQNAEVVRLRQELLAARQEVEAARAAREAAVQAAQHQEAEAAVLRRKLDAKAQELELVHKELILTNELL